MRTKPRKPVKRKSRKRPPTSKEVEPSLLGQNIKTARAKANLTQLALAQAIGFAGDDAGAVICRWENGTYAPTLDNLSRLAEALGVTVCSLLAKG